MTMLSVADVSVIENLPVVRLSMLHEMVGGGTAEFIGSGVVIAPGFVLTASHNLYIDAARVAELAADPRLPVRLTVDGNPPGSTPAEIRIQRGFVEGVPSETVAATEFEAAHLRGYDLESVTSKDLAVLSHTGALSLPVALLPGLAGFADESSLPGTVLRVAGYPLNVQPNALADGKTLLEATTAFESVYEEGAISYFIESYGGLSGGPVFARTIDGTSEVVIGVHTAIPSTPGVTLAAASFLRIAEVQTILHDVELSTEGADASVYRHSLLIGSSSIDTIAGSYRRDVIRGLGGEDRLERQGSHDLLEGGAGDDILVGDGDRVGQSTDAVGRANYDQFGDDFLDGGTGGGILFGENDTVLAGADHTLATTIEIGNAGAHQGTFDAAGYPGVTLTGDVVTITGTGGTDFVRNVETISLVKSGSDTATDTLKLYAFDAAALGQLETIDLAGGLDVIDLGSLASGMSVTLDSVARYT